METWAVLRGKWFKLLLVLAIVLPLQTGLWGGEARAEGPTDPAPFIAAKVVNGNAGKKVLFDNTHAQTAGAADWVIDGGFSDFANALAEDGFYVQELRKTTPFTYDDLMDYDVFVVAEPNIPFKTSEQAAMKQYVEQGGSIFFIADHYNADRNKNRWDGSEAINGYRRGAFGDPAKGMSADERNSAAMQNVTSTDWLSENFGVRVRYNALGDVSATHIVAPDQAFGITEGVRGVAMHAGSTLAITDPTKAKGIVYLPKTNAAWPNAVDQGVYNGGGVEEGPYVAVSKLGLGKAAFIGDSSPVEDATPKYLREETGARKTTYDGFKELDDAVLLVNLVNWLATQENYTSLTDVSGLALDQQTQLFPFEEPAASTEPQPEPWSAPAAGYKWYDRSTFKPGSYGGPRADENPEYSFIKQNVLPNAQEFQIRVVAENLAPHSTVSGFTAGIYLVGGTQVAMVQRDDGSWPTSYGYSTSFSLTANANGRAYKDLTVRIRPGTSGAANLRLRINGNNLITNAVSLGNVPAEPLPGEENPYPSVITVAEARSQSSGTVVAVEGIITTKPGIYGGGQSFYLQDDTGGLYIFQSAGGFQAGDVVKVTGTTALYNAEFELTDILAIEKTGVAALPSPTIASAVGEDNQGRLVRLEGVTLQEIVSAAPAGSFEFKVSGNNGDDTLVRVDARTGIDYASFPYAEGQKLTITGIASIFRGTYQLKVRSLDDFVLTVATEPPVTAAVLSKEPNGAGWLNEPATLSFATTGGISPVRTEYAWNNGIFRAYDAPLLLNEEGIHEVVYYSIDGAGNREAAQSLKIAIDRTAPAAAVSNDGEAIGALRPSDTLKPVLTASDSLSGIASRTLTLNGQTVPDGYSVTGAELGTGSHKLAYSVIDAAGNASSGEVIFRVQEVPSQLQPPGKPVLSHNNGQTGLLLGDYTVSMNMWWGVNGSEYRLYENGILIDSQVLAERSPAAQSAQSAIAGRKNGTYTYVAELLHEGGITRSEPLTVQVSNAAPGKPVLSHNNWDGDGDFTVTMNMWWGTNGTEYRLFENGTLIESQSLSAKTPSGQHAFTTLGNRPAGTYTYRAELINAAGETSSDTITVTVSRASAAKTAA